MPFEVGRRCYDRRPHIGADWTAHHILLGVLAEANARVSRNDFSKSIVDVQFDLHIGIPLSEG